MRAILIAGFVAVAANAQADTITEACALVIQDAAMLTNVVPRDVQSFPELTPPRVTMRIALREEVEPLPYVARCIFDRSSRPHGLQELCLDDRCFHASSNGEALLRFEEMKTLLERRGF